MTEARPTPRHFASGYSGTASVGTAASSPASMFPQSLPLSSCCQDMSISVSSSLRLPSPAVQPAYAGAARCQSNRSAGSTTPLYYDYSESFAEVGSVSSDPDLSMPPIPFNIDQTILDNESAPLLRHAQTPFGTVPGSTVQPSEMPTESNQSLGENSRTSNVTQLIGRNGGIVNSPEPLESHGALLKVSSKPC